jgi:hypothetical protein
VQQTGQCRVTQDIIHSLAAVLLALQSGEFLGRPVAGNDLVVHVENDGTVGHRVRRFANLAHELSVALLAARCLLMFVAKAREELLPDSLAVTKILEVAGPQPAIETQ